MFNKISSINGLNPNSISFEGLIKFLKYYLKNKIKIFFSHQLLKKINFFAFGLSDYLYLMQRGKIIQEGARDDLDKKAFKKQLSI